MLELKWLQNAKAMGRKVSMCWLISLATTPLNIIPKNTSPKVSSDQTFCRPHPIHHPALIRPYLTKSFSRGTAALISLGYNLEMRHSLWEGGGEGRREFYENENAWDYLKAWGAWVSEMFKHSCFPLRKNNFPILGNKGRPTSQLLNTRAAQNPGLLSWYVFKIL